MRQRIRDPLYDLIEFDLSDEFERALWEAMGTPAFQRLRRIKQLGFSEMVYPGASHTRLSHSLGVFHTARQLLQVIRRSGVQAQTKETHALAAALFHDLGHGPFSHAFEDVGKKLGLKYAEHESLSDTLIRDGEVGTILDKHLGTGWSANVADILGKKGATSIQHAVVSSQFDADRLDYMRRDRLMTGTQHAAIDFPWLVANLRVADVNIGVDDKQLGSTTTFVIGPKAIHAAEAYILGLFQLYPTVYFHKTTRCIEKLFTELLVCIHRYVQDCSEQRIGLPGNHPLIQFLQMPTDASRALALDDTVILGSLSQIMSGGDKFLSEIAERILTRKLYKCIDIRTHVTHQIDPRCENTAAQGDQIDKCCLRIQEELTALTDRMNNGEKWIFVDEGGRSPYRSVSESKGPLDRINVETEGGELVDLKERSSVVGALENFKFLRAYTKRDDEKAKKEIQGIMEREIASCRT